MRSVPLGGTGHPFFLLKLELARAAQQIFLEDPMPDQTREHSFHEALKRVWGVAEAKCKMSHSYNPR